MLSMSVSRGSFNNSKTTVIVESNFTSGSFYSGQAVLDKRLDNVTGTRVRLVQIKSVTNNVYVSGLGIFSSSLLGNLIMRRKFMLGSSTDTGIQTVKTYSNVICPFLFQDGTRSVFTSFDTQFGDMIEFDKSTPLESFDWSISLLSGSLSAYAGPGTTYSVSFVIDFYHLD